MACGKLKRYVVAKFDKPLTSPFYVSSFCVLGFEYNLGYLSSQSIKDNRLNPQHRGPNLKWSLPNVCSLSLAVSTFRFLRFVVKSLSAGVTWGAYQWSLSMSQHFRRLVLLSRVPTLTFIPKRLLVHQAI